MLPWGHLAVGYVVYSLGGRAWHRRAPGGQAVLVLAVATQLPDLIDKPLNWWFSVYDGRAIGHSLVFAIAACVLAVYVARNRDRIDLGAAFSVGLLTHLLGDSYPALLQGDLRALSFLLWPFRAPPTYPSDSFLDHLNVWIIRLRFLPYQSPRDLLATRFGQQLALLAALVGLWAVDGFPGLKALFRMVIRGSTRTE
ncbi:metal-dependent hydrolase [Halobellus ruber]|uniref:Metal-dependent hydrolase n=1 Tax=Halobellus ruber TaxID=2761102 RepID=A0A7J9SJN3_9EURY|nr:metal-dependent hydrolase [Halobellus ruber]MBB6646593.1 metal-dependent hydrolase [Halobellus ruber]